MKKIIVFLLLLVGCEQKVVYIDKPIIVPNNDTLFVSWSCGLSKTDTAWFLVRYRLVAYDENPQQGYYARYGDLSGYGSLKNDIDSVTLNKKFAAIRIPSNTKYYGYQIILIGYSMMPDNYKDSNTQLLNANMLTAQTRSGYPPIRIERLKFYDEKGIVVTAIGRGDTLASKVIPFF